MIVNANSKLQQVIQIQKWNNETCQCECKNYCTCNKDYSWNPSTCICENYKYLECIADTPAIVRDKVISVMDIDINKNDNSDKCNKNLSQ